MKVKDSIDLRWKIGDLLASLPAISEIDFTFTTDAKGRCKAIITWECESTPPIGCDHCGGDLVTCTCATETEMGEP